MQLNYSLFKILLKINKPQDAQNYVKTLIKTASSLIIKSLLKVVSKEAEES